MIYRALADLVFLLHLGFVVFVILGGLLILRSRKWIRLHLPALAWAVWIEFADWMCPLTPLENWLRRRGGLAGYNSSFIEEYLLPLLYPGSLTRQLQFLLLAINLAIYLYVFKRRRE